MTSQIYVSKLTSLVFVHSEEDFQKSGRDKKISIPILEGYSSLLYWFLTAAARDQKYLQSLLTLDGEKLYGLTIDGRFPEDHEFFETLAKFIMSNKKLIDEVKIEYVKYPKALEKELVIQQLQTIEV